MAKTGDRGRGTGEGRGESVVPELLNLRTAELPNGLFKGVI